MLEWHIDTLGDSALHAGLGANTFRMKVVYSPAEDPLKSEWKTDHLESNTLEGRYSPRK